MRRRADDGCAAVAGQARRATTLAPSSLGGRLDSCARRSIHAMFDCAPNQASPMLLCEWGHSQHVRLHAESPVRPSWKMATRRLDTHRFARPVRDRALSGEHECELSATRARLAMTPACDTGDVSDGTEQRNSANFEHEESATVGRRTKCRRLGAHAGAARHALVCAE